MREKVNDIHDPFNVLMYIYSSLHMSLGFTHES